MRPCLVSPTAFAATRNDRVSRPGAGIVLTGAASLLLWGLIAGIAAIV